MRTVMYGKYCRKVDVFSTLKSLLGSGQMAMTINSSHHFNQQAIRPHWIDKKSITLKTVKLTECWLRSSFITVVPQFILGFALSCLITVVTLYQSTLLTSRRLCWPKFNQEAMDSPKFTAVDWWNVSYSPWDIRPWHAHEPGDCVGNRKTRYNIMG